ncbi:MULTISPECIES: RNA-guided endonuclease TnpB family protein [Micromonospora]|uniref:Transposase n=1 Tax=Micromonospora sicca TaxID=2202420 RepID=A0A317DLC2_9ACTN|nr:MULTISPECIES: RNA-guided endonuclease TnpB family protein [unclassified Micromonospora]MBM0225027.1 transposase [Micromonospora sp. ATA51]PWR15427.1 transposase [Micromonospora sp. 4G51]
MRRAYTFLLRPTARQAAALAACLDDHRNLYNAALEERREAWRRSRVTVRYGDQSAQLKDIRRTDPSGQARWSFSSQQATLRRLEKAFAAFFRRVKSGQAPGYPRFKGSGWFDTVEWPKDRDGCRWDSAPDSGQVRLYLQGVGHVRVHAHRASDGVHVANPRYLAASTARLGAAQQVLARRERGSNRRRKARERVAALHARVRRQRLDHAHKTARWLVRHHDLIAHEDLRIGNMTRSAAGTLDAPGSNVAQKSGLNRSILDAGWGAFLRILAAKAESAGRLVVAVNPANTSRTCPQCGHCARDNRPTQAGFTCATCGYNGHADVVGASNILRAGLALQSVQAA